MTEEKSNQEEEKFEDIWEDETNDIKPTEGEDSDDASLTPEELSKYNERTGKNYKSLTWDEIAKKEKIADEAYRTKKVVEKEPQKNESVSYYDDDVIREVAIDKLVKKGIDEKTAEEIIEKAAAIGKTTGRSSLKVLKEEDWLIDKAIAISDAKKEDEANKEKIRKPSSGTAPSKTDVSKVKAEDVASLKPSEKIEWLKRQAEIERNSD